MATTQVARPYTSLGYNPQSDMDYVDTNTKVKN